jgi:hypothetical protein
MLSPFLYLLSRILHRQEPTLVQAFFSETPVERLYKGIIRRLAGTCSSVQMVFPQATLATPDASVLSRLFEHHSLLKKCNVMVYSSATARRSNGLQLDRRTLFEDEEDEFVWYSLSSHG